MFSKKKLLLIRSLPKSKNKLGGRELLDNLIQENLQKIFKKNFHVYSFKKRDKFKRNYLLSLFGYIDGIEPFQIDRILKLINTNKINTIFINGSNLGKIAEIIRLNFSNIKIIVFYHNVETKFFFDSFRFNKSMKSLLVMFTNFIAERKSVNNSDIRICLTKKDSSILKLIYGKRGNFIIPLALRDRLLKKTNSRKINNGNLILFVGGNFFANIQGIKWFIEKVLPKISLKLIIIGHNLKVLKKYQSKNLEIRSNVKNLNIWYKKAKFIISPIFYGSGMKTKVAEALMYGKTIIGTNNTFAGYDNVSRKIGILSNTTKEFMTNIQKLENKELKVFDNELRKIYLQKYSSSSFKKKLLKLFDNKNII